MRYRRNGIQICPCKTLRNIHEALWSLRAMRRKICLFIVLALVLGTAPTQADVWTPEMLQRNWTRSCAWASTVTALRMIDRPEGAEFVRSNYRGGVNLQNLASTLTGFGLKVRTTFRGDPDLLERTNCAIIDFGPTRDTRHAVVFCGYWNGKAVIADPNRRRLEMCDKSLFVKYWKRCGGRAVAID